MGVCTLDATGCWEGDNVLGWIAQHHAPVMLAKIGACGCTAGHDALSLLAVAVACLASALQRCNNISMPMSAECYKI